MVRMSLVIMVTLFLSIGILQAENSSDGAESVGPVAAFTATTFHGIGMGAYTGLAAGWVRYADRHEMQQVWESAGYGALGGVVLGAGSALAGKSGEDALNDVERLSTIGGGIGFCWGIVSALFTGESIRIADGMAWGHLAGVTAGLCYAGGKALAHKYPNEEKKKLDYSVGIIRDSASMPCPAVIVQKTF